MNPPRAKRLGQCKEHIGLGVIDYGAGKQHDAGGIKGQRHVAPVPTAKNEPGVLSGHAKRLQLKLDVCTAWEGELLDNKVLLSIAELS